MTSLFSNSGSGGSLRFFARRLRATISISSGMQRPHVVRIRQAEVFVEAVLQRQKLFVMAEVPLAEDGGGVAARLAQFGQRDFIGVDAVLRAAVRVRRGC